MNNLCGWKITLLKELFCSMDRALRPVIAKVRVPGQAWIFQVLFQALRLFFLLRDHVQFHILIHSPKYHSFNVFFVNIDEAIICVVFSQNLTLEPVLLKPLILFSKIQLVVYYQCCVLIGWATTRLYVIAH